MTLVIRPVKTAAYSCLTLAGGLERLFFAAKTMMPSEESAKEIVEM